MRRLRRQVKQLVLDALKAASEAHPNLRGYLKGTAAWYAGALALKAGEAPDDEQRLRDERKLAKKLEQFFEGQLDRILKEVKRQYKALSFEFWSEEEARGFILGAYNGKKKSRVFIDGADGLVSPVGWVFKYRDGDMNKADWVQLMEVDEKPLHF